MGTIVEDVLESAKWVAEALTGSGYKADFSPSSLWEIDRFFDENSKQGRPTPGGLLAEDLGARIFAVGGYIGEVIRKAKGGKWVGNDTDPQAEINIELQLPGGTTIWPVQRAVKRMKNGAEEGIAAYGHAFGLNVGARPGKPEKKPWWKPW